ncbi:hypothetical protein L903_24305 [Agrobacterium sp. JL28]|nr:hypothetical protein L903_24305 [Agrobacterium sp. JL28]
MVFSFFFSTFDGPVMLRASRPKGIKTACFAFNPKGAFRPTGQTPITINVMEKTSASPRAVRLCDNDLRQQG